jgi:tyrosine-protein kinase Etk/Wzc
MAGAETAVLKLAVLIAQRGRRIAAFVFATMLVVAVLVYLIPVIYTGTAVILAPQPSTGAAALLSQLGSFGSLGSELMEGGGGGGVKTPEETLLGVLGSRTIADNMIERFDLRRLYHTKSMVDTRKALAHHTRVEATKGYLVRINVDDRSAVRAADMANGYVDVLYSLNQTLALTQASQRRVFLEQQVNAEKEALNRAEIVLQKLQEKTGIIQMPAQAELTLRTIAQLRGEIVARELQLQQLKTIATEHNDRVAEMESGIAALNAQLSRAEKGAGAGDTSDFFIAAGRVPAAGVQYLRTTRELRYHEALFETLSKQYELARIDEAKAPPLLQVVDRAVPLDKKSWPPRTLLVLLSGVLATVFAVGWVLLCEAWSRARLRPETAEQLLRLRSAVGHWSQRQ